MRMFCFQLETVVAASNVIGAIARGRYQRLTLIWQCGAMFTLLVSGLGVLVLALLGGRYG